MSPFTCKNPRHFGEPLKGDHAGFWRYRIGDYRVLCDIQNEKVAGRALSINRSNANRGATRGKTTSDKYEDLKDIGN